MESNTAANDAEVLGEGSQSEVDVNSGHNTSAESTEEMPTAEQIFEAKAGLNAVAGGFIFILKQHKKTLERHGQYGQLMADAEEAVKKLLKPENPAPVRYRKKTNKNTLFKQMMKKKMSTLEKL